MSPHDALKDTAMPMPPDAIRGASAWYGSDLALRTDWIHPLSRKNLNEIAAAVRAYQASGVPLANISPASFLLPSMKRDLDAGPMVAQNARDCTGILSAANPHGSNNHFFQLA